MTRDELIEKAHAEWRRINAEDRDDHRSVFAVAVDTALAVFEEAHAPTDDEREAIIDALLDELGWEWDEVPEEHIPSSRAILGDMADRVLAVSARFRRSEVPEPSAAESDLPNGHAPVETLPPFLARRIAEPQGEPSDAQANAVARAIVEHDEERLSCFDHDGFCCPCGELHGATRSEWQRHQARAALRAAGEAA